MILTIANIISRYWREAIVLVLLMVIVALRFSYNNLEQEFTDYKNEIKVAAAVQIIEEKKEKDKRDKVNKEVLTSFQNSMDALKDYYAKNPVTITKLVHTSSNNKLQQSTGSDTCGKTAPAESTGRIVEGPNGVQETPSTGTPREIQVDIEQINRETVQCLELIKFNKQQNEITDETQN